jgi:hypothetical protein
LSKSDYTVLIPVSSTGKKASMEELAINLHMHTPYSDGHGSHAEIGRAALRAGLDAVIVTDHNILVDGVQGYQVEGKRRVLVLVGEEIHDRQANPQKNHLLVFGAGQELCMHAADPQRLLDQVERAGGFAYIAHPFEDEMPAMGEPEIPWRDWAIQGFTGLEIWNGFSEYKTVAKNWLQIAYYAFRPRALAHGPNPSTLQKWDELLASGRRVSALGGSDAHALQFHLGPFTKTIFPYEFHFRAVNTHLLTPERLSGDFEADRAMVLEALRKGSSFVGYDLPAPTRGFRFSAQGADGSANISESISARGGLTLQIRLPQKVECRLIHNGKLVKTWTNREVCTHITSQPGAYRVEAYIDYLGKRRGWIFSNPIYVTE